MSWSCALLRIPFGTGFINTGVPDNSPGFSRRGVFIERSFEKGDFMWPGRRRVHGE